MAQGDAAGLVDDVAADAVVGVGRTVAGGGFGPCCVDDGWGGAVRQGLVRPAGVVVAGELIEQVGVAVGQSTVVRASLGCGNPVAVADLRPGATVLDLGSGGGLDVLLSARRVGPSGTAYGVDGSTDRLALARANASHAGVRNARFLHGHIEDIPLPSGQVDVVISNRVINLSADKRRVLAEAFRVLRPGGRLGVSDVIADPGPDPQLQAEAENRIGCTSGTLTWAEYQDLLASAGFTAISITATSDAGGRLRSAIVRAVKPGLE